MAEEEKKEKTLPPKRSTAKKRDMQNIKKNARNRAFKSRIRTSLRNFEEALKGNKEEAKGALNIFYSLIDKAVKRGIFKLGKAKRQKSKTALRLK